MPAESKQRSLRDSVLGSLHRSALDDLASWLGLEDRRLLGERVDALALFRRWLLHHDHANEAGNDEDAILLQFGVTDGGHGFDDAFDRELTRVDGQHLTG